jgi:hypothetical protein
MALGRDIVEAIIREHDFRPIAGDVLLIGRQTIGLSRTEILELMTGLNIPQPGAAASSGNTVILRERQYQPITGEGLPVEYEVKNIAGPLEQPDSGADSIPSIAEFFALLGVQRVRVLEGRSGNADIVQDLGVPIADDLKATADFIIDCGALSDLFSPGAALRNYADMLRPGGRVLGINNMSPHFDPYATPNAQWYFDYFVANAFADCKVYVVVYFPDRPSNAFCLDIDCLLDTTREARAFLSPYEMATMFFAEKNDGSTSDRTPVHAHQRTEAEWADYRGRLAQMKASARPHLVRSRGDMIDIDIRGGHLFMDNEFRAMSPAETQPAQHEKVVNSPAADGALLDRLQSLIDSMNGQSTAMTRFLQMLADRAGASEKQARDSYTFRLFD